MSLLCVNTVIAARLLLNDSFKIPIVDLGTGTTNDEAVRDAIEAGYRHIDTSLNYKDSEKTIGQHLILLGPPHKPLASFLQSTHLKVGGLHPMH
jgi:diketogulonate reductase-like aldo/keto reductase